MLADTLEIKWYLSLILDAKVSARSIFATKTTIQTYMNENGLEHLHPLQVLVSVLRNQFVGLVSNWFALYGYQAPTQFDDEIVAGGGGFEDIDEA